MSSEQPYANAEAIEGTPQVTPAAELQLAGDTHAVIACPNEWVQWVLQALTPLQGTGHCGQIISPHERDTRVQTSLLPGMISPAGHSPLTRWTSHTLTGSQSSIDSLGDTSVVLDAHRLLNPDSPDLAQHPAIANRRCILISQWFTPAAADALKAYLQLEPMTYIHHGFYRPDVRFDLASVVDEDARFEEMRQRIASHQERLNGPGCVVVHGAGLHAGLVAANPDWEQLESTTSHTNPSTIYLGRKSAPDSLPVGSLDWIIHADLPTSPNNLLTWTRYLKPNGIMSVITEPETDVEIHQEQRSRDRPSSTVLGNVWSSLLTLTIPTSSDGHHGTWPLNRDAVATLAEQVGCPVSIIEASFSILENNDLIRCDKEIAMLTRQLWPDRRWADRWDAYLTWWGDATASMGSLLTARCLWNGLLDLVQSQDGPGSPDCGHCSMCKQRGVA